MNIYIDLGAHHGKTTENWMVLHPADIVFAWEPNPAALMNARWAGILQHYPQCHLIRAAAWTADTAIRLYRTPERLDSQSATAMRGKTSGDVSYDAGIIVEARSFSRWLKEIARPEDDVTVKMDIEGAEYAVLEQMIEEGTIGLVDKLLIEFHAAKFEGTGWALRHNLVRSALEFLRVPMEVADH